MHLCVFMDSESHPCRYIGYDLLFHILVLPEQMKKKSHLKYYGLLVSGSGCIISSILTHSITKTLALVVIQLLVSLIHCEGKTTDKPSFSFWLLY